ncbi:MAG: hypothetical protein AVDCRST_MAG49-4739, partial [uncultured Thermomicrobiales bacterium]
GGWPGGKWIGVRVTGRVRAGGDRASPGEHGRRRGRGRRHRRGRDPAPGDQGRAGGEARHRRPGGRPPPGPRADRRPPGL